MEKYILVPAEESPWQEVVNALQNEGAKKLARKLAESVELNTDQTITYPDGIVSSNIMELIKYFTNLEIYERPADALRFQNVLQIIKYSSSRVIWKSYTG